MKELSSYLEFSDDDATWSEMNEVDRYYDLVLPRIALGGRGVGHKVGQDELVLTNSWRFFVKITQSRASRVRPRRQGRLCIHKSTYCKSLHAYLRR